MFGEEDVEDKLDDKIILVGESDAPLLEEIKQIAAEEDEKQPSESIPDQLQAKPNENTAPELSKPVRWFFINILGGNQANL